MKDGSKSVNTPGEPNRRGDQEEYEARPLSEEKRIWYRGVVARGNYLAQDRGNIQYAVKELARGMSTPWEEHGRVLKRLGRYLTRPH